MKIAKRILVTVALAALLAPAVGTAQSNNRPNIGSVQITIKDIATRENVATVLPGGTVTLPEGARVRLNMQALPTGSARGPLYPATEYTDLSRGGIRITRSNEENSAADLEIVRSKNNTNRTDTLRFQIKEDWVPADLRTGSFSIRVVPADQAGDQGSWSDSSQVGDARARELTRTLYQAILLRDPDPGASGTIQAIQTGGYPAVKDAAVAIASSEESRIRLYDSGSVTNEKRLLALYRNLLGLDSSAIDRTEWEENLRRLNDGQIAQVVSDLVNSTRFYSHQGFETVGLIRR